MDSKTMTKINKYKEKKNILDDETRIFCIKIEKLRKKINRRKMKKEKLNDKLRIICKHKWVPNFPYYNVYDRPKICEICGIDK